MFNFNAETFVIFYPYGAGGRFLQMAMSLDPTILPIHTDTYRHPQADHLFEEYKNSLFTRHNNAHYNGSGHLPEYIPENIDYSNRYVFCIHQTELAPALVFLRQCQNLKIFIINTLTNESFTQLDIRRWFFAQRAELQHREGYKLHFNELQTIRSFNQTCKLRGLQWPVGSIELEDYWDPVRAIPALNKFFAKHGVRCNQWEELYHIWHNAAIKVPLNDCQSNS